MHKNRTLFSIYSGYKIYTLKVEFKDIIAQLETELKKEAVEAQEKIERLKKLGK